MMRVTSNEMVKVSLGDGQHDDITADSISYDERGGCWVAGLGARPVRARGFDVTTHEGRQRAEETAHLRWSIEDVFVGQDLTDANTLTSHDHDADQVGGSFVEAAAVSEPEAGDRPEPEPATSVLFPIDWNAS